VTVEDEVETAVIYPGSQTSGAALRDLRHQSRGPGTRRRFLTTPERHSTVRRSGSRVARFVNLPVWLQNRGLPR
jgi:hypothetical protein